MKRYLLPGCALLLLLSSCQRPPKTQLERGAGTFVRSCSGCHGLDGRGGISGFTVPPRDLRDATYMNQLSDEALRAVLQNGKGQMPPIGALLAPAEITDLLVFVRSLSTKPAAL